MHPTPDNTALERICTPEVPQDFIPVLCTLPEGPGVITERQIPELHLRPMALELCLQPPSHTQGWKQPGQRSASKILSNSEDHISHSLYKGYGPAPRCYPCGMSAIIGLHPFLPELLG